MPGEADIAIAAVTRRRDGPPFDRGLLQRVLGRDTALRDSARRDVIEGTLFVGIVRARERRAVLGAARRRARAAGHLQPLHEERTDAENLPAARGQREAQKTTADVLGISHAPF